MLAFVQRRAQVCRPRGVDAHAHRLALDAPKEPRHLAQLLPAVVIVFVPEPQRVANAFHFDAQVGAARAGGRQRRHGPVCTVARCADGRRVAFVVPELEAELDPFGGWLGGPVRRGRGASRLRLLLFLLLLRGLLGVRRGRQWPGSINSAWRCPCKYHQSRLIPFELPIGRHRHLGANKGVAERGVEYGRRGRVIVRRLAPKVGVWLRRQGKITHPFWHGGPRYIERRKRRTVRMHALFSGVENAPALSSCAPVCSQFMMSNPALVSQSRCLFYGSWWYVEWALIRAAWDKLTSRIGSGCRRRK